jgi:hypothetical protein
MRYTGPSIAPLDHCEFNNQLSKTNAIGKDGCVDMSGRALSTACKTN